MRVSGRNGLLGASALFPVGRVFSLGTGSVPVLRVQAVTSPVLVLTAMTKSASSPRATVSSELSGCWSVGGLQSNADGSLQVTEAGVSGVIGPSAPSHVVGASRAAEENVTVQLQRGREITARVL